MESLLIDNVPKIFRLSSGKTQEELAHSLKMSQSGVSARENSPLGSWNLSDLQAYCNNVGARLEISIIGESGLTFKIGQEKPKVKKLTRIEL